jgi:hypothetical protein
MAPVDTNEYAAEDENVTNVSNNDKHIVRVLLTLLSKLQ